MAIIQLRFCSMIMRPKSISELNQILLSGEENDSPKLVIFDIGDSELFQKMINSIGSKDVVYVDMNIVKGARDHFEIIAIPTTILMCALGEINRFVGIKSADFYAKILNSMQYGSCEFGVTEINSIDQFDSLLNGKRLLVLHVYSTSCLPCRVFNQTMYSLSVAALKWANAVFGKVNIISPLGSTIARAFGVSTLPTICLIANKNQITENEDLFDHVCFDGNPNCYTKVDFLTGYRSKAAVVAFIQMGLEKIKGEIHESRLRSVRKETNV
ncbi:hypothetical protein ACOME3_001430 [Neoechinorhynchus agilis]